MTKQNAASVKVQGSNGIKELLRTTAISTALAAAKTPTDLVLMQIQRDVVDTCDNHEDGWAMVKAIDVIKDTLLLFAVQGQNHLAEERTEAEHFAKNNQT